MAYFPFFVDLEGQPGLIVGGGRVALRKIEKLLPYGPRLTVAAPVISEAIRAIPGLTLAEQPFAPTMLEGMRFVVSAAGSREGNHAVSDACRARNIPVNVVDSKEDCTFLFPALVRDGPLSVGISTSGASPTAAAWLKERIAASLPEDFGALLTLLESLRETAKTSLPEEGRRSAFFAELFIRSVESRRLPEREEVEGLLQSYRKGEGK